MSGSAYPLQLSLPFEGSSMIAVANLERAVLDHGGLFHGSEGGGWFSLTSPWGRIFGAFARPAQRFDVGLLETPPRCDTEELLGWLKGLFETSEPPAEAGTLAISHYGGILTAVRR